MSGRSGRLTVKIILVLFIAAAMIAGLIGYRMMHMKKVSDEAEMVLQAMYQIVPDLGRETDVQSGDGQDPLPAMTINNIDIVGCLEVPSIDLTAPVTAKSEARAGFVYYVSGSAVKGGLMLSGSKGDVFSRIASLKPGSKAAFTDMDGVRYTYRVLTQFHLKKWDKADYDLMLYYNTDSKTRFVVGLNRDPN